MNALRHRRRPGPSSRPQSWRPGRSPPGRSAEPGPGGSPCWPRWAAGLWARVIAASASGALGAALSAAPAVAEAVGRALSVPNGLRAALSALLLLSGGSLALLARRLAKRPVRAASPPAARG
jgi:hypothetical protein